MRKTHAIASSLKKEDELPAALFAALGLAMAGLLLLCVPTRALAAEEDARRGGGNALARATVGIEHSNTASNLSPRWLFASTHGGMPEDVSPQQNGGAEDDGDEVPPPQDESGTFSLPENANENGVDNANGGATTGNGGDGGNAAPGGLIRAGSAVSNANAVNVLNVVLVRIGANI